MRKILVSAKLNKTEPKEILEALKKEADFMNNYNVDEIKAEIEMGFIKIYENEVVFEYEFF